MSDITKEEFIQYCAGIMEHKEAADPKTPTGTYFPVGVWASNGGSGRWNFNPWDDLNQRMQVIDKLMAVNNRNCLIFVEVGVDKATKDFIISTMPEKP